MFRFNRQSPAGTASGIVRSAAPFVLAAALQAAFAAWPCAALAQQQKSSGSGASAVPVNDRQSDTLSAAARQQQSDEERLLGGPSTSGNPYSVRPYSSNGASPEDAEDALTNEKHMHVNIPTGAAEAGTANGTGSAGASAGAAGGGGRTATSRSRIGPNGISRAGNAMTQRMAGTSTRKGAAGYDFGANATSRTSNIYGSPYGNPYASPDQANAELYKSPW
jgi:hypothetical protein